MDIWIKIRSIFEGKGAEDAEKAVNKTGGTMAETLHNAHRLEGGLNQLERAFGETTGASAGFSGALRVMAQGFRAFAMAGPQLLITVAIIALGTAINNIVGYFGELKKKNEDAAKATEDHTKAIGEMDRTRLTSLVKQYNDVRKAADEAADASERLQSAQMKLLSAQEKLQIAGIEAKSSAAIAALPQDANYDQNKKALEEQKARDVSDVQVTFANKQAEMEVQLEKQKEQKTEHDLFLAAQQENTLNGTLDSQVSQRRNIIQSPEFMSGTPLQLKQQDDKLLQLNATIAKAKEEIKDLKIQETHLENTLPVDQLNVQSADTTRNSTQLTGISKGLDFAAQNNEALAKDSPVISALANGDSSEQSLHNTIIAFATASVKKQTDLQAQLNQLTASLQ